MHGASDSTRTPTSQRSGGKLDRASQPQLLGNDAGSLESAERQDPLTFATRVKTWLIGKPRDLGDASVFKHLSLIAFLAWVGLGADGLSSSCYGPAEAFQNLGEHTYLAVFLAL